MDIEESYFFSKYNHIWGWATWRRAWKFYQLNNPDFEKDFKKFRFHNESEKDYWHSAFKNYYDGNIDTWDYPWTFTVWKNKGLCAYPTKNLVKNIGFGADATHTKTKNIKFEEMKLQHLGEITHTQHVELDYNLDRLAFEAAFSKKTSKKNSANLSNENKPRLKFDINQKQIQSPLTGKTNVRLLNSIPASKIINTYKTNYQAEVDEYFSQINSIEIYECLDTGFKFFYPYNLEGDSEFYAQLSKLPWYYMDSKWEHKSATKYITQNQTVLEIGCAKGSFLNDIIHDKGVNAVGLELNNQAVKTARQQGLNVYPQLLSEHIQSNEKYYDVICTFQVVEHIAAVRSFLEDSMDALKPGGRLIISVPNQDSFIGLDDANVLDMPPHHMGKWNERALKSLTKLFPLRLLALEFEPLQKYHFDYFTNVVRRTLKNDDNLHEKLVNLSRQMPDQVRGHTVLAVFEKLSSIRNTTLDLQNNKTSATPKLESDDLELFYNKTITCIDKKDLEGARFNLESALQSGAHDSQIENLYKLLKSRGTKEHHLSNSDTKDHLDESTKLHVTLINTSDSGGGKIKGFLKDQNKSYFMIGRDEIKNKTWEHQPDRILKKNDLQAINAPQLILKKASREDKKAPVKPLKVAIISTTDGGGAGKAAYRTHKGLQSIGLKSTMYVLDKKSCDPSVKTLVTSFQEYNNKMLKESTSPSFLLTQQKKRWESLLKAYPQRPSGLEIFTDTLSTVKIDTIPEIQEADIIHLHWIDGMIDWSRAYKYFGNKPVIWTLHDMYAFTGGCHYANGCQKYKQSCGECPQLGSLKENDLSQTNWQQKQKAYSDLNLNIVTLCKWMSECVKESSIFSNSSPIIIPNGFPLDIFKPYPKTEIRKALNIPASAKIILFGADGITNKRKGFNYLLKALEIYSAKKDSQEIILMFFF